MSASSRPFSDRERAELADLLDEVGPDAPTCCAGWTTAHLAAHLVVRDRRPDAQVGFALEKVSGRLAAHAHALESRLRESTPYACVVDRVRSGPPAWSPLAWPGGHRFNVSEFAIHHEDVRRAQPGWTPRSLPLADQDSLWAAAAVFALATARRGGVVLRRTDVPGVQKRIGSGARTVAGEPMELLLWAAGRSDVARVSVS